MIRHMALFRWIPEATQEQKQRVVTELGRLAPVLPTLRGYHVGPDLGLVEGNFDFAVAADFDDLDGYLTYRDNPSHRAVIAEFIQPIAAQRVAVQYEF
jgi:Stress responsive A/B Barrel Domain